MNQRTTTTLTLTGGVSYEKGITDVQGAEIILALAGQSGKAMATGMVDSDLTVPQQTMSSVQEDFPESPYKAIEVAGAKSNAQKIVALAKYSTLKKGSETFEMQDVQEGFQRAHVPVPRNISRDMRQAKASGWVRDGQESGTYTISHDFDKMFDGEFVFPKSKSMHKHTTTTQKPGIFASTKSFPTQLSDFPDYSRMVTEQDCVLWALECVKQQGISDGVDNGALAWLTGDLGKAVSHKNMSRLTRALRSKGYVQQVDNNHGMRVYEITPQGEDYLMHLGVGKKK